MQSGKMEALVRLIGEAVEVQIRGPSEMATCEEKNGIILNIINSF